MDICHNCKSSDTQQVTIHGSTSGDEDVDDYTVVVCNSCSSVTYPNGDAYSYTRCGSHDPGILSKGRKDK